jgi:hypothetical protein
VTTTATGSPTNRTVSVASGTWNISWFIIGKPLRGGSSARSAPVKTAITPGAACAPLTSIPVILACAMGERTKNAWQAPASRSSTTSSV